MAIIKKKMRAPTPDYDDEDDDAPRALAPTKKKGTALAVKDDVDPFADAGVGGENVRSTDLIIPRLTLLHEMSKATKKNRPEYVKGAAGGMFCIASMQKVFDGEEGLLVTPVLYNRRLIEWNPIDAGGGMVRADVPEEELDGMEKKNPGVYLTDNDTEVVVTPEYYILISEMDGSNPIAAVMSLTGKKAAASKRWNTLIMSQRRIDPKTEREVQMPFWFNTYHMTAVADSNDKGDYYIPSFTVFKPTHEMDPARYVAAKKFYEVVREGGVQAATPDER